MTLIDKLRLLTNKFSEHILDKTLSNVTVKIKKVDGSVEGEVNLMLWDLIKSLQKSPVGGVYKFIIGGELHEVVAGENRWEEV